MQPRRNTPRARWAVLAALAVCALAGAAAVPFARVPHVRASSRGALRITPPSGKAGTMVRVDIQFSAEKPTKYLLTATTVEAPTGGCASGQRIPGVPPVTVDVRGAVAEFPWPAALNKPKYWICAVPEQGTAPPAPSVDTFVVEDSPYLALTPTPVPPAALVQVTGGGTLPGSTLTVLLVNWLGPNVSPPSGVTLLPVDASGVGVQQVQFTVETGAVAGSYLVRVAIPADVPPGVYALSLSTNGSLRVPTAHFQVVGPPPTATAAPAAAVTPTTTASTPLVPLLLGAIGLTLLGLLALVVVLLRRRAAIR